MTSIETPAGLDSHLMLGVAAVMQHGVDHQLPYPIDIQIEPGLIALRVRPDDFQRWADTLVIDEESSKPGSSVAIAAHGLCLFHTAKGRLPGMGVRIEISGHMLAGHSEVA